MSFPPVPHTFHFQASAPPWPRKSPGRPPGPVGARRDNAEHPVLFLGGFFLAVAIAVIGLWQGLGLLLPP